MNENQIREIKISPTEQIRYWFDNHYQIHTAVWSNGECIVEDTDERLGTLFKHIAKYILDPEGKILI